MRNKILTQWLLCALGLWLLSQQCGQCFYDPGSQRWINRDPIGEDGGNNLLCFVFNNPANYLDGRGLEAGYRYNSDGTMTAPQGADREPFTPPPYPNPTTSPPMAPPGGNVE